jgi:choline transport protein
MDSHGEVPINLLYLVTVVNFVLSCIYLGSAVGFTIILSSANLLYALGFLPMFFCFIATRGRYLGKTGWFKLPLPVGMACATFSLVYLMFTVVVYCLPPIYPVTVQNMNWACVFAIFGMVFLTLVWKYYAKTRYFGFPDILEDLGSEGQQDHLGEKHDCLGGKDPIIAAEERKMSS